MSKISPRLFSLLLLPFIFLSCKGQESVFIESKSNDGVTIAYAEPISSYSPLSYEAKNRKYLSNIYETLLRYDSTFNLESGLAVSWGRLDDTTWDFRLRKNVVFHDGQTFDADDVLYSLQLAREQEGSDLAALLSTVSSVEKTAEDRVEIHTAEPDPLLPMKLTYVNIVPQNYENFEVPVGSGPYRASQFLEDTLVLERFKDYWGPLAYFEEARLQYLPDPEQRFEAIQKGTVDVLGNVPPQFVADLESEGITVKDFPSLEMSFLVLNEGSVFADSNLRAAVWNAIGTDYADRLGAGYLMETSQFAADGITGYNPEVESRRKNLDTARLYRSKVPGAVTVKLDLPQGLEALGEAIQADLAAVDITAELVVWPVEDYEDHILSGFSDLYFFGWKYDLADSLDFFTSVAHSPTETYGAFNAFSYKNPGLDKLVENAQTTLDPIQRRENLYHLTTILLEEQTILPLFESTVLYAIRPELYYDFRLDGQIWASEIVENMVE